MSSAKEDVPLTPETARQQVERLSAIYQISKMFSMDSDLRAAARSGLFSQEDVAQLEWIGRNPNVQELLVDYAKQREELINQDKETVRMWGDGTQATTEQREAYLRAVAMTESLNAVTANIFGAMGGVIAQKYFPDDPEMQAKIATSLKTLGEMWFSHGEAVNAGVEASEYTPLKAGMKLYSPDDEKDRHFPEAPDGEEIPIGGKTFNPYEREVESPEGEFPETPEEPVDTGSHFDMGVPMGVPNDQFAAPDGAVEQPGDTGSRGGFQDSFSAEESANQSLPNQTLASFPEDSIVNQSAPSLQGTQSDFPDAPESFEPNQSFDDNMERNQSFESNQSFPGTGFSNSSPLVEPNQSFPGNDFGNPSFPATPSFPVDPIGQSSMPISPMESQPLSSPPPMTSSPAFEPMQSNPIEPMESAPIAPPPIESAPIEPMASEPMSSPETMQSIGPSYDPG